MVGHGDGATELDPGAHLGEDVRAAFDLDAGFDDPQVDEVAHLGRGADLTLVGALVPLIHRLSAWGVGLFGFYICYKKLVSRQ